MIGFLIALGIGIAVGRDASRRGMNGGAWGVGVFFLLIIVLPIYFIKRKPLLAEQFAELDSETIDDLDALDKS